LATTYDATALATSPKDRARDILGDKGDLINPEDGSAIWLRTDEEIQALIDLFGFAEGVAQCAEALASRYAQEPDQYQDEAGMVVRWSFKVATWQALAARLRLTNDAPPSYGAPVFAPTTGPCFKGFKTQ
jgi:hypothetical protein